MIVMVRPEVAPMLKKSGLAHRMGDVLTKAAIVSHPKGNRRYHHWIFDIQDGKVIHMTDLRSAPKDLNTPEFYVWEQCECVDSLEANPLCKICGGRGEVKIRRVLPKK